MENSTFTISLGSDSKGPFLLHTDQIHQQILPPQEGQRKEKRDWQMPWREPSKEEERHKPWYPGVSWCLIAGVVSGFTMVMLRWAWKWKFKHRDEGGWEEKWDWTDINKNTQTEHKHWFGGTETEWRGRWRTEAPCPGKEGRRQVFWGYEKEGWVGAVGMS
jgi:hypothetical protein